MASRGQSITVTYVAWDTVANAGKTGDVANHTLRWVKDGTSAAPTNSPSEVDATNAPGLYKLVLTASECTCDFGVLAGKSSTTGISIVPVAVSFEQLPTVAPAANGGLPTVDANNYVAGIQGTKNQLDDLNDLADGVTVATNNDKTGYALSSAGVQAIWDALTSALTTVNSIGKRLVDNIDAAISSRLATAGYTAPDNAGIAAIKASTDNLPADPADASDIAAAFATVNTNLGTVAGYIDTEVAAIKAKTDNLPANPAATTDIPTAAAIRAEIDANSTKLDVAIGTRLAAAGYTAPDNAGITAIKAKTDLLPSGIQKNQALAGFTFLLVESGDHVSPLDGLGASVVAERSIDGGAFAPCANVVAEVGGGIYKIDLAAGDLNGNVITFRFTGAGADARFVTMVTEP